nr:glycerate kinase [Actinomycetota bacterium]
MNAGSSLAAAAVLVAPDDFKGTLHAAEVASAVASGLRAGGLDAEELPVADGGGGTMDVLV